MRATAPKSEKMSGSSIRLRSVHESCRGRRSYGQWLPAAGRAQAAGARAYLQMGASPKDILEALTTALES